MTSGEGSVRPIAQELTDIGVQGWVGELHRLDNACDGIPKNRQRTDQAVVSHGHCPDRRFSQIQGDRTCIRGGNRGILCSGADIERACAGNFHVHIMAVKSGLHAGSGGGGTLRIQLRFDGRVGDLIQHGYGVQEFVLLYVGLAQGFINGDTGS